MQQEVLINNNNNTTTQTTTQTTTTAAVIIFFFHHYYTLHFLVRSSSRPCREWENEKRCRQAYAQQHWLMRRKARGLYIELSGIIACHTFYCVI